ncbi:signal transduction histidine kinase [Vibrio diazotrophicus]|uniref:histidine kinase n=1 Tax=Vibrio diazotrophicus TaxID=685 RepID=A0A329E087_VIBDI|nr:ATP-binding protein [Vibrio diazotrophicus]RAS57087.1 signal transduction histidine kinase [Vibrio diazotrophicus]
MLRLSSSLRFALIITMSFVVSTWLATYVAVSIQSKELKQRLFQDTEYLARTLANNLSNHGVIALKKQIDDQMSFNQDGSILIRFWDKQSNSVYGTLPLATPFSGPTVINIPYLQSSTENEENDGIYYAYGIDMPNGKIVVARSGRWVTDTQELFSQSLMAGLGCAMVVIAMIAFLLTQKGARRLANIDSVLKLIASGDLSARCQISGASKDELHIVAIRINSTLDKLEGSISNLQQVSMDIAHDLRRPLTRLRLRLEQVLQNNGTNQPIEDEISHSIVELDQLSATFDAILHLAQIESGSQHVVLEPIDISALCYDIYETFEPVFEDSGRRLKLSCSTSIITINANYSLLQQAIVNLLENALRHTPPGSNTLLSLQQETDIISIIVSDDGPGIPKHERENVLKRFYQLDESRTSDSTGLGLSLVSAIIHRHEAELRLLDNEPGLCVQLIFSSSPY